MGNAALLLMDYQAGICTVAGAGSASEVTRRHVLPLAQSCLAAARAVSLPVIHVRVAFDDTYSLRTNRTPRFDGMEAAGGLRLGTESAAFCPEVEPRDGEIIITKGCVNPFIGTALTERLIGMGIRRLYVGGVATNFVVESATRHAADSGFAVTIVEDICASFDPEMHEFAIKRVLPAFATIVTAAEFKAKMAGN